MCLNRSRSDWGQSLYTIVPEAIGDNRATLTRAYVATTPACKLDFFGPPTPASLLGFIAHGVHFKGNPRKGGKKLLQD